ncbi:MAG: hypothetical protein R3B13_20260 [Polyangiaceae bacterium]
MNARALLAVVLCVSSVSIASACGDSDSGAAGSGGKPGLPLLEAGPEASAVECGGSTCEPMSFRDVTTLSACCAENGCGIDLTSLSPYLPAAAECTPLNSAGVADPACPSHAAPSTLYGAQLQGCCRADHTCGVFVKLSADIDLGCVTAGSVLEEASTSLPCGFGDANVGDAAVGDANVGDAAVGDAAVGDGALDANDGDAFAPDANVADAAEAG